MQLFKDGLDGGGVVVGQGFFELGAELLHLGLVFGAHLVAEVSELFFGLINQGFGLILEVDFLALLFIGRSIGLRILDHAIDFVVTQGGSPGDRNALLLAAALVLGSDAEDAIGINVEGHLNLGHATGGRRDAIQAEGAQGLVVAGHFPFALQHVNLHIGLTVHGGGVGLGLLGGDGGVATNHLGHHTTEGFHPKREGRDIQQQDVLDLAGEHTALNRGTNGHHLIRVDRLIWILASDPLDQFQHRRDAGGTAHHDDLIEFAGGELGVLEGLLHRHAATVDELGGQLLKLGPGEGDVEMLGALRCCGDEGEIDLALGGAGELDLGLFGRLGKALQGLFVLAQVDAFVGLEAVGQVIHDHLVEVIAAQVSIATGRKHFEDTVADFEYGDIEGAAAQVKDENALVILLVQAVGQGRGGGLVDNAQNLKASDLAGVLGGLTLGIVEIGRHGDHRLGDRFTEVLASIFSQLAQHLGRDFLGGELLVEHGALHLDIGAGLLNGITHLLGFFVDFINTAADETLDRIEGIFGVHDRLTLGDLTYQLVLVLRVGHHRGGRAEAFGVGDHGGLTALHHRDATVGGAEVNTDDLTHGFSAPVSNELGMNASSAGHPCPGEGWFPNRSGGSNHAKPLAGKGLQPAYSRPSPRRCHVRDPYRNA